MTDSEFKILFSVMAGCGYKLFLSTEYKLLDIWHDSFLPHVCKCFMNICMKQFTFFYRFRGEQTLWNDIN